MSTNIVHTNIATTTNGAPMVPAPVEADREAILRYLKILWPDGPMNDYICLWRKDGGAKWIGGATTEQGSLALLGLAADYAAEHSENMFAGLCLAAADYGPNVRLSRKEGRLAQASCGLWMDFDLCGPGHASENYPVSIEQVVEILERAGLKRFPPTLAVWSSNAGLHLYWLWKEVWHFAATSERLHDRDQFTSLLRRFQRLVREAAGAMKLAVDSTCDPERVLRPAGTKRLKPGCDAIATRFCDMLSSGTRYNPSEFEELLEGVVDQHQSREDAPVKVGLIRIDPRATITSEDFKLLMEVDAPGLSPIWNLTKHLSEKAVPDDSFHERDMQMANYLARVGYDAQRIATWLIHFRREKAKPEHRHAKHLGYYEISIRKAIESAEDDRKKKDRRQDTETKKQSEAAETAQIEEQKKKASQSEAAARAVLKDVLDRDITEMRVLIDNDRRTYQLVVDRLVITIGGSTAIFAPETVSRLIWERTGEPLPPVKKRTWTKVVLDAFYRIRREIAVDQDHGRVRRWLFEWFTTAGGIAPNENDFERTVVEMVTGKHCFRPSGFAKIYDDYSCALRAHHFTSWVRRIGEDGNEETSGSIRQKLIAAGFERRESLTITLRDGAKVKLRDVYVGVVDWFKELHGGEGEQRSEPENAA